MIIAIFLIVAVFVVGMILLNAWLLSMAVPMLLADPTNWWAWVLIAAVVVMLFGTTKDLISKK